MRTAPATFLLLLAIGCSPTPQPDKTNTGIASFHRELAAMKVALNDSTPDEFRSQRLKLLACYEEHRTELASLQTDFRTLTRILEHLEQMFPQVINHPHLILDKPGLADSMHEMNSSVGIEKTYLVTSNITNRSLFVHASFIAARLCDMLRSRLDSQAK